MIPIQRRHHPQSQQNCYNEARPPRRISSFVNNLQHKYRYKCKYSASANTRKCTGTSASAIQVQVQVQVQCSTVQVQYKYRYKCKWPWKKCVHSEKPTWRSGAPGPIFLTAQCESQQISAPNSRTQIHASNQSHMDFIHCLTKKNMTIHNLDILQLCATAL